MEQVVFLVCHAGFGPQVVLACIRTFPVHIMLKEFAKQHIAWCIEDSVWLWILGWVASFVALLASQVAASTSLHCLLGGLACLWSDVQVILRIINPTGMLNVPLSHEKQEFQSNSSRYSLFTKRSLFYWPTVRFSLERGSFPIIKLPLSLPLCRSELLLTYVEFCWCWFSFQHPSLHWTGPNTLKKKKNTPAEGCVGSAGLWNRCGMRRGEKNKTKQKAESLTGHRTARVCFTSISLNFFFSLFVFHDEFQTQDEKNTSTGLFSGSRCVFSNIMKACVWVSPPISPGD